MVLGKAPACLLLPPDESTCACAMTGKIRRKGLGTSQVCACAVTGAAGARVTAAAQQEIHSTAPWVPRVCSRRGVADCVRAVVPTCHQNGFPPTVEGCDREVRRCCVDESGLRGKGSGCASPRLSRKKTIEGRDLRRTVHPGPSRHQDCAPAVRCYV